MNLQVASTLSQYQYTRV